MNLSGSCLFGGSFDPPHLAHIAIAAAAVAQCGLERVIFLPCQRSPLKGRAPGASGEQRLDMLRLATAELAWAEVSAWELAGDGPSYSWRTAEHFSRADPGHRWHWLMGADQWADLQRWSRVEYLASLVTFIVFPRDGVKPTPRAGMRARFLSGEFPGSSTEVRARIAGGGSAADLLARPVSDYITTQGLYREV